MVHLYDSACSAGGCPHLLLALNGYSAGANGERGPGACSHRRPHTQADHGTSHGARRYAGGRSNLQATRGASSSAGQTYQPVRCARERNFLPAQSPHCNQRTAQVTMDLFQT